MNKLIDLSKVAGLAVNFQVVKGEIIYLKENSKSSLLVDAILGRSASTANEGKVLEWQLTDLDTSSTQQLRKQIGYVDTEMYLDREQSIAANFRLYADAAELNYSSSFTLLENYLKKLDISSGEKVRNLDVAALYATRFAICMAKEPQIIISEDQPHSANPLAFQMTQKNIYHLALSEGITFITLISDPILSEQLPGRYIDL